MYLGIINEVMRDHRICMLPTAFQAVRNLILSNIDSHAGGIQFEKQPIAERLDFSPAPVPSVSPDGSQASVAVGSAAAQDGGDTSPSPSQDQTSTPTGYINLIHLQGPMTRGGGGCSYGSREIRDCIINAAHDPECCGHIILTDTPGGMCSCLPDFRMAINEAHKNGQQVMMLIDGIAASCGAFVGAMCDGIYYTNPKDEIGSIGMYASFFTLANGAENKITSEVYHEYYASRSTDKNAWQRQAADGDTKQLQAEIDHDLDLLIADLSADRPSILDEQKTGKMYTVSDVVGSLVDGQSTLTELASAIVADYSSRNGAPLPLKPGATASTDLEPEPAPEPEEQTDGGDTSPSPSAPVPAASPAGSQAPVSGSAAPDTLNSQPSTQNSMKQYPTISAALQMGDAIMESDAENLLTLQPEEADSLEAALNNRNAQIVALTAELTAAREAQQAAEQAQQQAATDLTAAREAQQAAEQALADANQQIADLQSAATEATTAHEQAIADLNAAHDSQLTALNSQLSAAQQQAADNQQTIADLRSENDRLSAAQGSPVKAGAEPAADPAPLPAAPRILNREETMALAKQQLGH